MADDRKKIDPKEFWKATYLDELENMKTKLLEAVEAEKEGRYGECHKCGASVKVSVPDTRARVDAMKTLAALAGEAVKPTTAGASQGGGIALKRILVMPKGDMVELGPTGLDPAA